MQIMDQLLDKNKRKNKKIDKYFYFKNVKCMSYSTYCKANYYHTT